MDLAAIESRLMSGEELKIKYKYPRQLGPGEKGSAYGVRSDKLVDVSTELRRFYVIFRGQTPIWIEENEVIEITPDDGVYQEFEE
ncbi:MAG: hypothetical protein QHH26_00020 [Armatimonadota bacterium]|nr:hypothetical protein [Armatimonadota bacterium]